MNKFYTTKGDRPDLAMIGKLSQAALGGYAFPKLYPVIPVTEKAGSIAYAPAGLTNATGIAGRANGAALTGTALSTAQLDFTTARLEARSIIYADEVKGFGGIEAADQFGGENAVRRAYNTVEVAAAAKLFTSARQTAATELTDHAVVKTLQQQALAVRAYGDAYLVMTSNAWLAFLDIPEIRARMFAALGGTGNLAFLGSGTEAAVKTVSTLMGFAGVIMFDSSVVGTGYDGFVAVVGLRAAAFGGGAAALNAIKSAACYGAAVIYIPDEANMDQPFSVSSFDDRDNKLNAYDAESRYSLNELHTAGQAVCKFAAAYTEYGEAV